MGLGLPLLEHRHDSQPSKASLLQTSAASWSRDQGHSLSPFSSHRHCPGCRSSRAAGPLRGGRGKGEENQNRRLCPVLRPRVPGPSCPASWLCSMSFDSLAPMMPQAAPENASVVQPHQLLRFPWSLSDSHSVPTLQPGIAACRLSTR